MFALVELLTKQCSIAYSPNGWTDTELSMQWLEKVFIPHIHKKHRLGAPVILQLDGHNSHTTYQFALLCAKHGIEQVISPSHTTHRLQPCDVAVFSPLAAAYKRIISQAAMTGTRLTKRSLPFLYGKARMEAFKPETIKTAFRKAGVWPLDRLAIEDNAYEPSKNTTSEASMPIPVLQPALLIKMSQPLAMDSESAASPLTKLPDMEVPDIVEYNSDNVNIRIAVDEPESNWIMSEQDMAADNIPLPSTSFRLAGLVPPFRRNSTRESLLKENQLLRGLLEQAKKQIEADHALKLLMQDENGRIRLELHGKKKVERKRAPGEGRARLMTSSEQLDALAEYDWKHKMEEVLHSKRAKEIFKERRILIKGDEDSQAEELRLERRAEEVRLKAAEKREKKITLTLERARKADMKRQERESAQAINDLKRLAEKTRKAEDRKKALEIKKAAKAKGAKLNPRKPNKPLNQALQSDTEGGRCSRVSVSMPEGIQVDASTDVNTSAVFLSDLSRPLQDKTVIQKSRENQTASSNSKIVISKAPVRTTRSATRRQAEVLV